MLATKSQKALNNNSIVKNAINNFLNRQPKASKELNLIYNSPSNIKFELPSDNSTTYSYNNSHKSSLSCLDDIEDTNLIKNKTFPEKGYFKRYDGVLKFNLSDKNDEDRDKE